MNRYTIAYIISKRNIYEGATFDSRDWPLHITIAGSYLDDTPIEKILAQLQTIASSIKQFDVTVSDYANFGPNGEVPVYTINLHLSLKELHYKVVAQLKLNGVQFRHPEFVNEGYKPHATVQKTEQVKTGDIITLKSFSLVMHEPNSIAHERQIIKTFILD